MSFPCSLLFVCLIINRVSLARIAHGLGSVCSTLCWRRGFVFLFFVFFFRKILISVRIHATVKVQCHDFFSRASQNHAFSCSWTRRTNTSPVVKRRAHFSYCSLRPHSVLVLRKMMEIRSDRMFSVCTVESPVKMRWLKTKVTFKLHRESECTRNSQTRLVKKVPVSLI